MNMVCESSDSSRGERATTSALKEPRDAHEESPRRFVGFPFRLQPNPQPGRQRDMRRLDRQVMREGEDKGLDGVEPSNTFIGFLPGRPLTTVTFISE